MENTPSPQSEEKKPWLSNRRLAALIIAALFVVGAVQALTGSKGFVTTEINDQYLGVDGTYGAPVFWELAAISDVQLVDAVDLGSCVEGEETKNTASGTYFIEGSGACTVHIYLKGPYIIARSPDGTLVFNCASPSATKKLYSQLAEVCPERS